MKTCTKCNQNKELTEFYKNGPRLRPDCKTCTGNRNNAHKRKFKEKHLRQVKNWQKRNPEKLKQYWIKQEYGLSADQYREMLISQSNKCKICNKEAKLVVDHDHVTGKVRGLLCNPCNTAIGFLKESVDNLNRAIIYLSKA